MKEFYLTNKEFKEYVDKYASYRKITIEEAFTHTVVRNVYLYYKGDL